MFFISSPFYAKNAELYLLNIDRFSFLFKKINGKRQRKNAPQKFSHNESFSDKLITEIFILTLFLFLHCGGS